MLLTIIAPPPSLYDAIRVYYVSSFQGIALPIGGLGPDLVRYAHLRSSQVSSKAVGVSIVMERIIGLLATVVVALIAATILVNKVGFSRETSVLFNWVLLGGGVAVVLLTGMLFSRTVQYAIYRQLAQVEFVSRHSSFSNVISVLKQNSDASGALLMNLVLSVIEQLFPVIAFFVGGVAFQIPLNISDCLAVVPIGTFLQRLPISYAGLGIREGALVFLFGLLDISYSDALILSSALFLVYLSSLLPGAIWSFVHKGFEPLERTAQR